MVLQGASLATLANVGHMLCSAISDPFGPHYYRLHGLWHQLSCTAASGTVYLAVSKLALMGRGGGKSKVQ